MTHNTWYRSSTWREYNFHWNNIWTEVKDNRFAERSSDLRQDCLWRTSHCFLHHHPIASSSASEHSARLRHVLNVEQNWNWLSWQGSIISLWWMIEKRRASLSLLISRRRSCLRSTQSRSISLYTSTAVHWKLFFSFRLEVMFQEYLDPTSISG